MKGDDRRAGRASTTADVSPDAEHGHRLPRARHDELRGPGPMVISAAADEVALSALHARRESTATTSCDVCERAIEGEPAGSGLYFWTRDGDARWEEPALCARCAPAIGMSAHKRFTSEDEGGE
jgi:hypothetical protein